MRSSALLVLALAACDRPSPLVLCHNANCAEPVNPEADDTIAAMRESLALEYDGRPTIDGMELDSILRDADNACLFAHDFDQVNPAPAIDSANELAAYFARTGPISYGDRPFRIELELKASTSDVPLKRHTPEQRMIHAQCAWELYTILDEAAAANGRDIEVIFASFSPELIAALVASRPQITIAPVIYEALQGIPKPLDAETRPLDDYAGLPITAVEVHSQWFSDAQYEAIRSRDLELGFFMFSATAETFAQVEQFQPTMVVTSEATLFRRWIAW